ncbi:MAG: glycoside hydrolase family 3 C-terminal domain-containing protein [Lachnospiraceae bacterium]|nr:glycoside hydrolase family 3 C-terminal domain-containing protein [Lachnospiraceae bacterium]
MIFKNKHTRTWMIVSIILAAVLTAVTILATSTYEPIIKTVLGGDTPIRDTSVKAAYVSAYESKDAVHEAGDKLNVQIESEGAVLLLNEKNALPISKDAKVSVFGKSSVKLVLGGSGSGGGSSEGASTLFDGLTAAGISYNETLKAFYEDDKRSGTGRSDTPALTEGSSGSPTLYMGETPADTLKADEAVKNSIKDYKDAAIVVFSRLGGESWDLPRFQDTTAGGTEGRHYLQLDANEYALLDYVTGRFDNVIVILNTLTSFQCDFIDEYNNTSDPLIDAVLWIGGPGTAGAQAIGKLLTGEVNPSGRTTDLYSKDFTKDPTWQNFGDNSQVNGGQDGSAYMENGSPVANRNFIAYEEGIYTGYRYYETRAYEESKKDASSTWYADNVRFPFGYGLSYTTFSQKIDSITGSLEGKDGAVTISITSQNTGSVPGKDVIELYVTLPYYFGGIEKSYVQLVDFAKTPVLAPNETYTATFTVKAYDLASYDYNDANMNEFKGYELEAGEYIFRAGKNSHEYYDSKSIELASSVTFKEDTTTGYEVKNLYTSDDFLDLQYRLQDVLVELESGETVTRKGMTRTDFEGSFPTAPTAAEREVLSKENMTEKEALADQTHNNPWVVSVTAMPKTGEGIAVTMRDVVGKPYDDPAWETLLDELTFNDMVNLVNDGAFETYAIPSIDKNLTNDSDGPIGFVNFMPGLDSHYTNNTTFASEIVIASTWNKDLAYQMGRIVGETGLWGDVDGNGLPYTGWYAPAINLHRSPFSGRNFEYYSEDPILTGKMAVNVINGTAKGGVYTDLKHFALNDQETNRSGVATFCTEQALRELYLKPFELGVKGYDVVAESAKEDQVTAYVGTKGIMSSFNRIGTRWTGGDYRLMTEILRNEWGFRGLVICDYKTDNSFMNSRQMLYAGNDLILASTKPLLWNDASATSAQDVAILRTASHNILYAVANSNAMNAKITGYMMAWWKILIIGLDVVGAIAIALWGFSAFKKAKKEEENA